jgi:hypothetical protein
MRSEEDNLGRLATKYEQAVKSLGEHVRGLVQRHDIFDAGPTTVALGRTDLSAVIAAYYAQLITTSYASGKELAADLVQRSNEYSNHIGRLRSNVKRLELMADALEWWCERKGDSKLSDFARGGDDLEVDRQVGEERGAPDEELFRQRMTNLYTTHTQIHSWIARNPTKGISASMAASWLRHEAEETRKALSLAMTKYWTLFVRSGILKILLDGFVDGRSLLSELDGMRQHYERLATDRCYLFEQCDEMLSKSGSTLMVVYGEISAALISWGLKLPYKHHRILQRAARRKGYVLRQTPIGGQNR